ncbi:hypothetical protein AGMMS49992_21850 [Clostridia bacterium]|nr:hypothetical protein AGMMS49992_21850 [Clostridia bacterium]
MKRHLEHPDLSVSFLADRLDITPTYLSNFFKGQTGQNLLETIQRMRVQKGKEYLLETSLTMHDIAAKLGYSNDLPFVRAFKKYEGITPGLYRSNRLSTEDPLQEL